MELNKLRRNEIPYLDTGNAPDASITILLLLISDLDALDAF